MGIRLEFLSQKKGFSFDIMKFSILSSKRISLSRLYSIENVLSAELGYPVKIIKDEDYINVEFPDLCPREGHFDSTAERIKKNKSILRLPLEERKIVIRPSLICIICLIFRLPETVIPDS